MLPKLKKQFGAIAIEYVLTFAIIAAVLFVTVNSMRDELAQLVEFASVIISDWIY